MAHGVTCIVTPKKTKTIEKTLASRKACDILRHDNEQQHRLSRLGQPLYRDGLPAD